VQTFEPGRFVAGCLAAVRSTGAGEWDAPDVRRRDYRDGWLERLLAALEKADLIAT